MNTEELARKNVDLTINLNSYCDMLNCLNRVQIVLIVEREEWQLCTACYEKYLIAFEQPDAAEQRSLKNKSPVRAVFEYLGLLEPQSSSQNGPTPATNPFQCDTCKGFGGHFYWCPLLEGENKPAAAESTNIDTGD